MAEQQSKVCTNCGSTNLREHLPVNRLGISYLSGILVKTKPIRADLCLDCGKINMYLEEPEGLNGMEVVQSPSSNFLPFVLFALFILSLQLDS